MPSDNQANDLKRTLLFDRHLALGARMVPFVGYEMPVQYRLGVLREHLWTREHAGLFDISHMGQALLVADDASHESVASALEALVPADILSLSPGRQCYTQLLTDDGGILDDLMVTRPAESGSAGTLRLVLNASRSAADQQHIAARLSPGTRLLPDPNSALVALQGPRAAECLSVLVPGAERMAFMDSRMMMAGRIECRIWRSGYTGEDGFEISLPADRAGEIWDRLLSDDRVAAIGLGARDALRLEAGLCLYGRDIDETTSPVEAGLSWLIGRRRREAGDFAGAQRILRELRDGPSRRRVGIRPDGRAPARGGTQILSATGDAIGIVTSGGFSPSLDAPIAMGYVAAAHSTSGTLAQLVVRGKPLPAHVVDLPFVPHRYARRSV
jgi:aminomethyltransferase